MQRDFFEAFEKKDDGESEFHFVWKEESKGEIDGIKRATEKGKESNLAFSESVALNPKKEDRSHYSPAERMYLDLLKRGEYSA